MSNRTSIVANYLAHRPVGMRMQFMETSSPQGHRTNTQDFNAADTLVSTGLLARSQRFPPLPQMANTVGATGPILLLTETGIYPACCLSFAGIERSLNRRLEFAPCEACGQMTCRTVAYGETCMTVTKRGLDIRLSSAGRQFLDGRFLGEGQNQCRSLGHGAQPQPFVS